MVALGRGIVQVTQLHGVEAGFEFFSCNDPGDPPSKGWSAGTPPNQSYVGTVIGKGGIAAQLGGGPTGVSPTANIDIYGECRNMTDHHNDDKTNGQDVTADVAG